MIESEFIWKDGELVPWADANFHVLTHALHYGSGVFEGIRAYDTGSGTAVFRMRDHFERLHRSARSYGMPLEWSVDDLGIATKGVLSANRLASGYVRPIAFYGLGAIGLNPMSAEVHTVVAAWKWGAYLGDEGVQNGIRTRLSSWRRFPQHSFPNAKATGTYINSILAKTDAVKAGYDEAIMLSGDGQVAEGSGENLFLVSGGTVRTPSLSSGCLDGITRDSVMTLLRDAGYEVTEAEIAPEELFEADELFMTGTAAEVTPVREVDDRPIGTGKPGEVTRLAQRLYAEVTAGKRPEYRDWLAYV